MTTLPKLTVSLFFIFFLLTGCDVSEKMEPSGFNSDFDFDTNQSFEEYIVHTKENILKKGRTDLDSPNVDKIVDWNAPFLLSAPKSCPASLKKRGILLIHGLSDSPFSMRSLGEHFQKKCFTVFGILLTGHGTRPADLLQVSYKSWQNQVRYAATKLKEKVDELYLGGFSTGAVLSFDYVATDEEIAGLILISPSFKLPFAASLASMVKFFRPMISWHDNHDLVKYESLALNGVSELNKLLKVLDTSLAKKNSPTKNIKVFTAISYEDTTINPVASLDYLLKHINLGKSKIIIYHQQDSQLPDRFLNKKNIIPVVSTMKKNQILNFSHVSLLHHSTNKWYGIDGDYRNCLHYEKQSEDRLSCRNEENILWGEVTKKNLSKGVVARITFNPMLEDLFSSMDDFFNN